MTQHRLREFREENAQDVVSEDLFAHVTALVEGDASVQEGDKVTYDKDAAMTFAWSYAAKPFEGRSPYEFM